jgi:hypothetical protein
VTTVGISDERPKEPRRLRRDMAKIGQLVLDRGRWNGERVVSETWIKAATAPQIKTSKRRRYARNILPPGSGPALLEPSHGVSHQVARVRPVIKHSGDRAIPPLKHGPDVRKEGIIAARVSSHTVDIRGGAVEFGPVRILQTDAEIQPWPKRRTPMAER